MAPVAEAKGLVGCQNLSLPLLARLVAEAFLLAAQLVLPSGGQLAQRHPTGPPGMGLTAFSFTVVSHSLADGRKETLCDIYLGTLKW